MWAAAYVKRDLDRKIRHIMASKASDSKDGVVVKDGLQARIYNLCQSVKGETIGVLMKKCRRKDVDDEALANLVRSMVDSGLLRLEETTGRNGKPTKRLFAVE